MQSSNNSQSPLPKFPGIRRKPVDLGSIETVKSSPLIAGGTLPLLMESSGEQVDLAAWIAGNRPHLIRLLHEWGAILFRGFPLKTADQFERAAAASCEELYGGYGDLPRAGASENIYTSTPYPPEKSILFHNESSHLHSWPMRISFFCMIAAQQGGETPIMDCREVCRRLSPETLETFIDKGLLYVRNFIPGIDVSWQNFFHTEEKSVVEQTCAAEGLGLEWRADGGLCIKHRTQAVAYHPRTQEMVFFNQIQLHHPYFLDEDVRTSMVSIFGENSLPRNVFYGDGSPIEEPILKELDRVFNQIAVVAPWQEGDIIMLDNMLAAHARNPYVGPRRIVVAMGDMISGSSLVPVESGSRPANS